jgi:hypothetical protein
MARAELPSGAWVEYRDKLKASDRFAVQAVVSVELGGDNSKNRASFLEMQNDMRNALLGRIVTDWSYPCPIPANDSFRAADMVLGDAMDLEDYSALEKAVEPLMDLIAGRNLPDPKKPATG